MNTAEADLAFPIIGFGGDGVMVGTDSAEKFGRLIGSDISDMVGLEIIDASFRQFRILAVHKIRPARSGIAGWLLGLIIRRYWVDYTLQALPPTTLEGARAKVVAAIEADPWAFCGGLHDDARVQVGVRRAKAAKTMRGLHGLVAKDFFGA